MYREQRFRLSYPLAWQPTGATTNTKWNTSTETKNPNQKLSRVDSAEITGNNARCSRLRHWHQESSSSSTRTRDDFQDMDNANERQNWLEDFTDRLYENQDFASPSISWTSYKTLHVDPRGTPAQATGWPTIWSYHETRDTFLNPMVQQQIISLGDYWTPMVDGIRVRGLFRPAAPQPIARLALWTEKVWAAKEATSISTINRDGEVLGNCTLMR